MLSSSLQFSLLFFHFHFHQHRRVNKKQWLWENVLILLGGFLFSLFSPHSYAVMYANAIVGSWNLLSLSLAIKEEKPTRTIHTETEWQPQSDDDFKTMSVFRVKREVILRERKFHLRIFSGFIIVMVVLLSGKQWWTSLESNNNLKRFATLTATLFYRLVHCNAISHPFHSLSPMLWWLSSPPIQQRTTHHCAWCIKCFVTHNSNGFFIMIYSSNARSVVVVVTRSLLTLISHSTKVFKHKISTRLKTLASS